MEVMKTDLMAIIDKMNFDISKKTDILLSCLAKVETSNQRLLIETEKQKQDIGKINLKISEELTSLAKKVDTVSDSQKLILSRMNEMEAKSKDLEKKWEKTQEFQRNLLAEIDERDRRRPNLMISGIPEKTEGSAAERKDFDNEQVEALFHNLDRDLGCDDILKSFRVGKSDSKPRLLKVICLDSATKRKVLTKAKTLRTIASYKDVYVNPDLTPLQQKQNKDLREELKRRKNSAEDVVLRGGKVSLRENFH